MMEFGNLKLIILTLWKKQSPGNAKSSSLDIKQSDFISRNNPNCRQEHNGCSWICFLITAQSAILFSIKMSDE